MWKYGSYFYHKVVVALLIVCSGPGQGRPNRPEPGQGRPNDLGSGLGRKYR